MNNEERVSYILNKLLKKRLKPNTIQTFFKLREFPKKTLNKELENFQEDLKNYSSGVMLWLNDKYPSVVLKYSLVGLELSNLNIRSNMRVVVDEYYKFIADVKEKKLELFNEEMEESKKKIFASEVQTKDLSSKNPYINYITTRYTKNMEALAPQIKIYADMVTPEIKQFGTSNMKNLIKLPFFMIKTKRIQKKTLTKLNEISTDVIDMNEEFKRVYYENPSIAYQLLTLISNIDSFNIDFTKFVARLFKIKSKGDGSVKYESFEQINPKHYDFETRIKLKNFLKDDLESEYPELSTYIRSMFNYNKYRKLASHKNPKVREIIEGKAYFMRPGKTDLVMDLNEIMRETRTYGYFIDSLRLF